MPHGADVTYGAVTLTRGIGVMTYPREEVRPPNIRRRSTTVLVLSGGGFQGLSVVKALRQLSAVRVIVADCHVENVSRYFSDAFFEAPLLNEPTAFVEFVADLCVSQGVTVIFPSTDHELDLLCKNRERFAAMGITTYVSSARVLSLSSDKRQFYDWLDQCGIARLPTYSSPLSPDAAFPLIAKPRRGWGGQGVHVAATAADAVAIGAYRDDLVWQSCLDNFDEYSVDFAIDVDGRMSDMGFRRRVRTLGGFAILGEPGAPQPVQEVALATISNLARRGALGLMNLQVLHTDSGSYVSDLNARAGTSLPLTLATGLNPVRFLLHGNGASDADHSDSRATRTIRYLAERAVSKVNLTGIRGIVFDLDDTLFDQKRWMYGKLEITWEQAKTFLPARNTFVALALQIIEEGNRSHLFDALCSQLNLGEESRASLMDFYRGARPTGDFLYPDVVSTLEQLGFSGLRLGILSDNPPASQRLKLLASGLDSMVDAIVLTGDLDTSKPDPKAFGAVADAMCIPAHDLVMVGDNIFRDIDGSLSAGFRHAFFIRREGGFFNFSQSLVRRALGRPLTVTHLETLSELQWYLPLRGGRHD